MVIVLRDKGESLGKDLTVLRDPQAKSPDAKSPMAKPPLIEESPREIPAAKTPPNNTRVTAIKKWLLSRLPSKNTSNPTAKMGMVAAARAAVVASVIACATTRRRDPKPKPIPPIQKPWNQGSLIKLTLRSNNNIKNSIVSRARRLRKAVRENTPQVCKRCSAAGNPKANRTTAAAQKILPRIFTIFLLQIFIDAKI